MTTLVIAEKPSVARDLARVLGARSRGDGYLEGPGLKVSWCVGHLLELAPPEAYDPAWKKWSMAALPMLPEHFQLQVRKGASKQVSILKGLMRARDVTRIVNACDAGREGELIFRYVWDHVFGQRRGPPVERLWVASLTDEAIRDAWARMRPSASVDPLAAAARCRSEADWLVGLNATRAMTLLGRRAGGDSALLSVGRVQTPTLAMLTAREDAIEAFVPEPFWQIVATFSPPSVPAASGATPPRPDYRGTWRDGDNDRVTNPDGAARAAAIATAVTGQPGHITAVTRDEVRERAPALFDLTALQKLANQRFGMSADRTLKAAQALYEEHKAITYPRTDARFVTTDMASKLPEILRAQGDHAALGEAVATALALGPKPHRKVVDDREVSDHHAILPTTKVPDTTRLSPDERRVLELVVRRFVAVFLPEAVFDKRTITTLVAGHTFFSEGRTRVAVGWHAAEPPPPARDEPPLLPDVKVGESVATRAVDVRESRTQPPKRFTEATLLGAMENAGKDLDEDELRRAMRESGLGTPATRAAIIETLLSRDFIRRDGKTLVPTTSGRALIRALPVASLRSPELTGAWEARLVRMADGRDDAGAFMAEIRRFTTEVVAAIAAVAAKGEPEAAALGAGQARESLGRCPVCGGDVTAGRRAYGCSRGKDCTFVIFTTIAGRKISPDLVRVLLSRGRSSALPGFRGKSGTRFRAALVLGPDGKVVFDFDQSAPGSKARREGTRKGRTGDTSATGDGRTRPAKVPKSPPDPRPRCPKCRDGHVMAGRRAWGCTRWREGCDFVVSFEHETLRIPDDEADRLFRKGETRLMTGLHPDGRARLVLDIQAPGHVRIERGRR